MYMHVGIGHFLDEIWVYMYILCTCAAVPTIKDGSMKGSGAKVVSKAASTKGTQRATPRKVGKKGPTSKVVVQKSATSKVMQSATPKKVVQKKSATPKKVVQKKECYTKEGDTRGCHTKEDCTEKGQPKEKRAKREHPKE